MKNYYLKLLFILWAVSFVHAQSPPVGNDLSLDTNEDINLNITLTATDPEGNSLGFAIVNGSANGALSAWTTVNDSAASTIYTPNQDYYGFDSFTFSITNTSGLSDTDVVSITVI